MINWKLEHCKLLTLKEHPRNPRELSKHEYEQLKMSLDKFGLIDKPIINADGMIIGGHQRVKVLLDSGITEAECYVPDRDLTEDEVDELVIRLNKNTGKWDYDVLANEWDVADLLTWGFEDFEIGLGDDDMSIDTEGSPVPDKKSSMLQCPGCRAKFEKKEFKVVNGQTESE